MVVLTLTGEATYLVALTKEEKEMILNALYSSIKMADEQNRPERADKVEVLFKQFQDLH